jgi:hypothetical protein
VNAMMRLTPEIALPAGRHSLHHQGFAAHQGRADGFC